MKKLILLLSVITLSYASIGKISAIRGDAVVITDGIETKALLNHKLNEKDIVKTSNNARLQIIFNDNTVTTLGKNTSLIINDYLLNGKNSKVNLEVNQGSFKVITGEISKIARKNFSLKAQTATIGIRGTVFIGEVGFNVNKLACLQGAIDVKVGNKSSLINSGKQISFKENKIVKIEALKANDFSLTKANIIQEKQEEIKAKKEAIKENKENAKEENKQSNKHITSITLGSDIKSQIPNSNSKNTLKTDEQIAINDDIKEVVEDIINDDVIPMIPLEPAKPIKPINNKYFTSNDKGTYYYSSDGKIKNGSTKKEAAEINLKTGNLNVFIKTQNNVDIDKFKKYNLSSNGKLVVSEYSDNSIKTNDYVFNPIINGKDGKTDYVISDSDGKVFIAANKDSLLANMLDEYFELNASNSSDYYLLSEKWKNIEEHLALKNKNFFNSNDLGKIFYYNSTTASLKLDILNPSLIYYFANTSIAKKVTIDFAKDDKITYYIANKNKFLFYEYDINDKSISKIDGNSPFKIDVATKDQNGKNQKLELSADKKNASFALGDIISNMLNDVNSESYYQDHQNKFENYTMFYRQRHFVGDEDQNFYFSNNSSAARLNPKKSEFEGYLSNFNNYNDLIKIAFDKNNGHAILAKRMNGQTINVHQTTNYAVSTKKAIGNNFQLNTTNTRFNTFEVGVNANKNNLRVRSKIDIGGSIVNINKSLKRNTDDKIYNSVKNNFNSAIKNKP